ncbi:TadA family conjugal transfer-associated ATPase [Dermatophilaceae bacterium Soc4.6]
MSRRLGDESPVWQQIRRGVAPGGDAIREVATTGLATLGTGGVRGLDRGLRSQLLGAGPLDPLLAEPGVTDVAVNGDGSVWVDRGAGMQRVDLDLGDVEARRHLVVRLAGLAGRRLDETAPYVDGQLPSGVRMHAILPPLVAGGPHLTLRVPGSRRVSLAELGAAGMFPVEWLDVLQALMVRRVAFVVSGGTGAGKTTLLAALLALTGADERLVLVEDVRELAVQHPHVVRLEARPANVEGAGEVTLAVLVRQALRMRPDRLVVGEVRGAEVRELLSALNTGHEGGCGTVHANTAHDVVPRFEALGALGGMTPAAVHAQLVSAVRVILHVRRSVAADPRSGRGRRLETVAVVRPAPAGSPDRAPRSVEALTWDGRSVTTGPAWPELAALAGLDVTGGLSRQHGVGS